MFKLIYYLYLKCNNIYRKKGKTFFVRTLGKLYSSLLSLFYSAYIPYTVEIGNDPFFIHHFHGIFISKDTIIGDNCTIHHHVTIGSSKDPHLPIGSGDRVSPLIGNNVYIGANVCIIGKCKIGDYVVIGAGTTIANTNIPANSLVVPQKWRVLKRNKNEDYDESNNESI